MERWERQAQLAGITKEGKFHRWFKNPERGVPGSLTLSEAYGELSLVWEEGSDRRKPEGEKDVLRKFIRLAKGSPESILGFAERHGVLNLCFEHKLASSHFRLLDDHTPFCFPRRIEPIRVWRAYAREAKAIISIASEIRLGRSGNRRDWVDLHIAREDRRSRRFRLLKGVNRDGYEPAFDRVSPEEAQTWLSRFVQDWIEEGGLRPKFTWKGKSPEITLGGEGLFSELARQVAFGVAAADGWVVCTECGSPYSPSRKPTRDRRNFCPGCGPKAGPKHAKRDQRARDRAKGRSSKEGRDGVV